MNAGGSHESGADSAPRLAAVNGLRDIAILAVIYHHLLAHRLTPLLGAPGVVVKGFWFDAYVLGVNGWLGVNLFFVLSGLVLHLPYAAGTRQIETRAALFTFYRRRAHRLLPLYYISLLVYMLASRQGYVVSERFFVEFLKLVTFEFAWSNDMFMPLLNVPLWSLGVEVWFSVLFPALVLAVRRFGIGKVMAFAFALSFVVRLWATLVWDGGLNAYHLQWKDGLPGRLDDFVAGMAIAEWLARRRVTPGALASTVAVAAGALLVLAGALGWDNVAVGVFDYTVAAGLNVVIVAGLGLVVAGMVSRPPLLLRLLLANRPLQLAGAMCYSLYLWHMVGVQGAPDPSWTVDGILLYIAAIFVLAALSYRFIEFPEKSARALFLQFPRPRVVAVPGSSNERKFAASAGALETVPESGGPT